MKWAKFLIGLGIGFTCGYLAAKTVEKTSAITPEKALQSVKKSLAEMGKIESSWMMMTPETYQKNGLTYQVYRCGITLRTGDSLKKFEVVCDATSGVIIDIMED